MRPWPKRKGRISDWQFVVGLVGAIVVLVFVVPRDAAPVVPPSTVFITELAAATEAGLEDDDGERSDWIELVNLGGVRVNLEGWHLTDKYHTLTKWRFPLVELAPGARVVVFASGKDRREAGRGLHTNFELDERGEYLALIRPDGRTVAQEFLPRFPRQHGGYSFGLRESLLDARVRSGIPIDAYRYFERATPGRPNADELDGVVSAVRVSEPSGLPAGPVMVALFSATPGAQIRYTTNGNQPTASEGLPYREPLRVRATTLLRAMAWRPGMASSDVTTRNYLFPADVPDQSGAGFPVSWGSTNGVPVRAYYGLSRAAVDAVEARTRVVDALRSLPTLAITSETSNLFDAVTGIYANPMEHGAVWERPVVAEWLQVGVGRGFQIACGLRIQGGWNRKPEECPKHSFRLAFRKEHGQARLQYPLFGSDGVKEFNSLVLRGGCNNSWLHWSGEERRRGDYLRDQWMRETQAAMGHAAARGRFAHLYLNGLYWGIYNVVERPDAGWVSRLEGGSPGDYDSLGAGQVQGGDTNAWHELFARANAGLEDGAAYEAISEQLDLVAFADYMILNYFGANGDWDRASNWFAARRRATGGRFRFFVWDAERTLEKVEDNTMDFDDDASPTRLFHKLEGNAAFRRLFAERVRRHCGEGGALSPAVAAERFRVLAEQLEAAIPAESARWGGYRNDVHRYRTGPFERYTVEGHWKPEIQRLLTKYFPRRTEAFLEILRQRGLL